MSGAVIKTVSIDGATFRLSFKMGTMRLAEQQLGKEILPNLGSVAGISALFWAVLQPAHRMTQEATDDLIDAAGLKQVGEWLGDGMREYQGVPAEEAEDDGAGEPEPAAKAGKK